MEILSFVLKVFKDFILETDDFKMFLGGDLKTDVLVLSFFVVGLVFFLFGCRGVGCVGFFFYFWGVVWDFVCFCFFSLKQKGSLHTYINQWTQCSASPNTWCAPAPNYMAPRPSADLLHYVYIFLVLQNPKPNTVLPLWSQVYFPAMLSTLILI